MHYPYWSDHWSGSGSVFILVHGSGSRGIKLRESKVNQLGFFVGNYIFKSEPKNVANIYDLGTVLIFFLT